MWPYNPATHTNAGEPIGAIYAAMHPTAPSPQTGFPRPLPGPPESPQQKAADKLKAAQLAREIAALQGRMPSASDAASWAAHPGWVTAGLAHWSVSSTPVRSFVNMDGEVKAEGYIEGPFTCELIRGQMATVLMSLANRRIWLLAQLQKQTPSQ